MRCKAQQCYVGHRATREVAIASGHNFQIGTAAPNHVSGISTSRLGEILSKRNLQAVRRAVAADQPSSPQPVAALPTAEEDTIAAIVTGISQGSVAIIRLSGSEAVQMAARVFRPGGKFKFNWGPESHRVYYGTAVDGEENALDEVLLISMLSPRSYTCEDVIELHCHGGGVCAQRVLQACIEAGARPARPGEFTLRAFLNGRLDLTQAENVLQLVQARTPAAADSALAGVRDGVGEAVSTMRLQCLQLLAELEARLDFDEDMPDMDMQRLKQSVASIQQGIEGALRTARQSTLLRQGLQVAIVGRPNVGKSSLLNAWTRTNRAIVTDIAGTTRDVLEAGLVVGGVPVTLLDTAGIRDSSDVVERLGVERSQAAAAQADIVVMVIDAQVGWTQEDTDIFHSLWGNGANTKGCSVKGLSLLVANKQDLVKTEEEKSQVISGHSVEILGIRESSGLNEIERHSDALSHQGTAASGADEVSASIGSPLPVQPVYNIAGGKNSKLEHMNMSSQLRLPLICRETFQEVVFTSATTRQGLEELDAGILALAGAPDLAAGGVSWSVNERQSEALVRAHEGLMRVSESVSQNLPIDFWTIDMRSAIMALGEVTGDEVTEQILDNVFSRFCIGK
ncbi:hypothetical protein CEUSTIGMA_g4987.t1 [Chlamydomonas eustigma]|uniref:TrmE-type G domain-containing protein n=1 Tax=Chlamydomonas eustigma TaxID=1157962 RepID=A0A250X385_9CHLO|nr:hypothetical protein CEUSTIGMA_g4987.t1 [Chlamydomonas eustigma]|eukprot:GAX77543.1 hypothetical protein CEUSTIGMA_g4987.t1 [Chlamydomonas eustigma]